MPASPTLACPRCKMPLDRLDQGSYHCIGCALTFPIRLGIPDLRYPQSVQEDPTERALVERLAGPFEAVSYEDLLDVYFSAPAFADVPAHVIARIKAHRAIQRERGQAFTEMFLASMCPYYQPPDQTWALEVGCGSGAGLVALAEQYEQVVGLDPSLPELLLARKFLDDNGAANVSLVQGYGQALPFAGGEFAYATAQNVLEHVFDVNAVIADIARILKPGGCFAADSRNRFDLFFPEPHVKVRWVGMAPRRWAKTYVRWRTGLDYDDMHAYLLSYGQLRRALVRAFGDHWRIVLPGVKAYDMPAAADAILGRVSKVKLLNALLLRVFPSHLALAQKA